jgi:hypothetical protein
MALVSVGPVLWPDPTPYLQCTMVSSAATFRLLAADNRMGWVFVVPRSGTATRAGIRVGSAADPQDLRIGLYTTDSSGNFTTTPYGGSGYGVITSVAANTCFEATLGAPATLTQGDLAALVLELDSSAGDVYWSFTGGTANPSGLGYSAHYTGTWSKQSNGLCPFAHLYLSDEGGTYAAIGAMPFAGAQETGAYSVNTAGADEYALRVTVPFACRVAGIWHTFGTTAGAAYAAVLYSGTTALRSAAVPGGHAGATNGVRSVYFSSGCAVAAGDTVRAAIRPTTGTSLTYRRYTLSAAGSEQSLGVPQGTCESSRVDQGAWADTGTRLPSIGLILDRLDDGAGGGLLRHPGMGGGIGG